MCKREDHQLKLKYLNAKMTQPEREDDTTFATMSQKLDMTICWLQCLMGTRRIVGYHV